MRRGVRDDVIASQPGGPVYEEGVGSCQLFCLLFYQNRNTFKLEVSITLN
jgi:hypothetical protein